MPAFEPAHIRFARFVQRQPDGCWEWTGGIFKGLGYGKFNAGNGKTVYAHRFSYASHHGKIPAGMVVMHSCDNRTCVNPSHLSVGTQAENVQDMMAKGRCRSRGKPGSGNGCAKLDEHQVMLLRSKYADRQPGFCKQAAREFGISMTTAGKILRGRSWSHI